MLLKNVRLTELEVLCQISNLYKGIRKGDTDKMAFNEDDEIRESCVYLEKTHIRQRNSKKTIIRGNFGCLRNSKEAHCNFKEKNLGANDRKWGQRNSQGLSNIVPYVSFLGDRSVVMEMILRVNSVEFISGPKQQQKEICKTKIRAPFWEFN